MTTPTIKTAAIIGARSMLGYTLAQRLRAQGITPLTIGRAADDDIRLDLRSDDVPDVAHLSVDVIFHCAAGFADNSPQGLRENFRLNTASALQVAELARQLGASRMVYAGSLSSDPALDGGAMTSYGLTKALAEQLLNWAMQQQEGGFTSLRFPQLYDTEGRCCRHQPWFGRIIAYASRGLDLRMPASLGPRNFIHVADAADLMIRAATSGVTGTLDIAHPEPLTWQQIADLAYAAFGQGGGAQIAPEKAPFRAVQFPDGASAFARLGLAPTISMAGGIARIVAAGTAPAFGPMDVS
ncbi:NAD-dependent epimerase/dehydratase family protein [Xanthobacteraceae bacterium A53D]